MCIGALVRVGWQQLLTSKLDPPQDEEDEDGNEDYGDACTNHHPHHLKRKEQKMKRAAALKLHVRGCFNLLKALHYLIYMLVLAKYY